MEKRTIPVFIKNDHLYSIISEIKQSAHFSELQIEMSGIDKVANKIHDYLIMDDECFILNKNLKIDYKKIFLIITNEKNINIETNDHNIIKVNTPLIIRDLFTNILNVIRQDEIHSNRKLRFRLFIYDPSMRTLANKNTSLRFTEKEAQIFECMLHNNNIYLSKKMLLEKVWSYNDSIDTHTLETHIYSLRKKIEKNLLLKNLIIFEEKKRLFIEQERTLVFKRSKVNVLFPRHLSHFDKHHAQFVSLQ